MSAFSHARNHSRLKDQPPSLVRNGLQRAWRARFAYFALIPTFILLAIFSYYPFANAMIRSTFDWNGVNEGQFVGLENFTTLLSLQIVPLNPERDEQTGEALRDEDGNLSYPSIRRTIRDREDLDDFLPMTTFQWGDQQIHILAKDPVFLLAMRNMFIFLIVDVTKAILIPLLLAVMIYHLWSPKSRYIFRILLILPAIVPSIVGVLLWRDFYSISTVANNPGLVNQLLGLINPAWQHPWLGDANTVLPALLFMGFPWVNGSNTLILLAGLLSIPSEIYDAAKIDGAKGWTIFRKIELPLLRGPIRLVLIFALIGTVQNYSGILIMTGGGPNNASQVPGLWLYTNAFEYSRYGYASAIGVILFVILIGFTLLSQRALSDIA